MDAHARDSAPGDLARLRPGGADRQPQPG